MLFGRFHIILRNDLLGNSALCASAFHCVFGNFNKKSLYFVVILTCKKLGSCFIFANDACCRSKWEPDQTTAILLLFRSIGIVPSIASTVYVNKMPSLLWNKSFWFVPRFKKFAFQFNGEHCICWIQWTQYLFFYSVFIFHECCCYLWLCCDAATHYHRFNYFKCNWHIYSSVWFIRFRCTVYWMNHERRQNAIN